MAIAPGGGVLDGQALDRLKQAARDNSPEALKATATQFEAMFLDMVMKSMREAAPSEGLFDSEQGRMMQGMLDQQYAQALASRGIGLADVLVRQMQPRGTPADPAGAVASPAAAPLPGAVAPQPSPAARADSPAAAFVERHLSHAEAASAATGIPAKFMIGQAALETGWGKREILHADGSPSFNVFSIKAGAGWKGQVADVLTTEYADGVAHKRVEKFRAYGSYDEAFADYARMLTTSPRYRDALASAPDAGRFAEALQKAGYATDPAYAAKLKGVIAKV